MVTDEESKSIKEEMEKHVLYLIRLRIITGREMLVGREKDFAHLMEPRSGDSW